MNIRNLIMSIKKLTILDPSVIKTIECVNSCIFFTIYKIVFYDNTCIYLITNLSIRNKYTTFNNIKLKHIFGKLFICKSDV